jgi:hypothetical protein
VREIGPIQEEGDRALAFNKDIAAQKSNKEVPDDR